MSSRKRMRSESGARRPGINWRSNLGSRVYATAKAWKSANPGSKAGIFVHGVDASASKHFGSSWRRATPEQRAARTAAGYVGRGKYSAWTRAAKDLRLVSAGRRIVDAASRRAASLIGGGMYTGHGAYTNSLVGGGVAAEVPQVYSHADETGAVVVSRREYICDIYGPTSAFNVQSYALNPGLEGTFPWLAQIAANYDEYEFQQLVFHYRSTTTDIGTSTSGQCGTVIMATNYNAAAAPFGDKAVMMEYDGAMSCKTTESMTHGVECDPAKRAGADALYVRSNPVVVNQDPKTYDHGLFQLAVANSPDGFKNQSIGELWVSYTVRLAKPKFFTARGLGISRDIFVSGNGTETTTLFMGTDAALLTGQQNNLGCIVDLSSTPGRAKITFPAAYAGTVEIFCAIEGFTCAALGSPLSSTVTLGGNVTAVSDLYGCGGSTTDGDAPRSLQFSYTNLGWAGSAATNTSGSLTVHVRIAPATNGVNNTVEIGVGTLTGAPTQGYISIQEYNSGFSTRALNIGPVGAQSDAPILVNKSGIVVVP